MFKFSAHYDNTMHMHQSDDGNSSDDDAAFMNYSMLWINQRFEQLGADLPPPVTEYSPRQLSQHADTASAKYTPSQCSHSTTDSASTELSQSRGSSGGLSHASAITRRECKDKGKWAKCLGVVKQLRARFRLFSDKVTPKIRKLRMHAAAARQMGLRKLGACACRRLRRVLKRRSKRHLNMEKLSLVRYEGPITR